MIKIGGLITLMMVAAGTSEMLVNFYENTQPKNPKDSHLHTHYCENLKSQHRVTVIY
jgi:hypothetical protein